MKILMLRSLRMLPLSVEVSTIFFKKKNCSNIVSSFICIAVTLIHPGRKKQQEQDFK